MPSLPRSEAGAYELLEQLRWGAAGPRCPHCGVDARSYVLRPRHGTRSTRTGAPTARPLWKCGACRRQFSVLVGTVLQGTRVPVRIWVAVLADTAAAGEPPAAAVVSARYGVTPASARGMVRRLGAAIARAEGPLPAALLRITPADAARIRERTPTRQRPRRQAGPSADYGAGA